MKRQLIIATIALSTTGLAACGSSTDQAKSAGEEIGASIAAIQSTVMQRSEQSRLEGIETQVEKLKDILPADAEKQVEDAQTKFHARITAAENHSEEINAAITEAVTEFTSVQGSNATVNAFREGVKKGYADGSK